MSKLHTIVTTLKSTGQLILNKGIAIVIAAILILSFLRSSGGPFIELLYAITLLASIIVVAPFVRLLVFPEAAEFAEQGKLKALLVTPGAAFTPALVHYFFATAISFICTILCVIPLLKL